MRDKYDKRQRRIRKIRGRIRRANVNRLSVHRSARHIYAQIFTSDGERSLVSASSLDSEIRKQVSNGGNRVAARLVGELLARRSMQASVERVAFDRGGRDYHGRVCALAEAARKGGLKF